MSATTFSQQSEAMQASTSHTFTLVFESGAVAVLQMIGLGFFAARYMAYSVIPDCRYEVRDGDQSAEYVGGAFCYYSYSWTTGGGLAQA